MIEVYPSSYSLGYCMYCGTNKSKLTKEHIVPYSLEGDLTAESASCVQCQEIINKYETDCTRKMLGSARAILGYRSRKKTTAASELNMPLGKHNGNELSHAGNFSVPKSRFPLVVVLPILGRPGLLSGKENTWSGQCWSFSEQKIGTEFVQINGDETEPVRLLSLMNPISWFRMIAKVAHGVVCVSHRRGSFKPLLTDFILAKSNEYGPFIGNISEINRYGPFPSYSVETFYTSISGCTYVGVQVQLLGELTTPQYSVIAGKMTT